MATIQELESALVKADAAGDTAAAKAFADEIRRMRTPAAKETPKAAPARKPKPSDQVFERSALLSLPSAAIYSGAKELGLGATELAGRGLRAVGLETPGNALVRMAQTGRAETPLDVARAQQAYPNAFAGIKLGSQIAMTAPLGGILAAPVRAVSPTLATAIRTGGMTVPATSSAVTKTALRAAGGATLGGASAALVNPEDAATGAVLGAAVPTIAAPVLKMTASGIGKLIDYTKGRVSDVRAAELLQEAFGGDTNTIVNILKNAPDDVTARQAMVDAGIDADAVFALGEQVEKRNLSGAFSRLAEAADTKRKGLLATASGGKTQESARAARETAKGKLTEVTTPMREEALAAANVGRGLAGDFGVPTEGIIKNIVGKLNKPEIAVSDENSAILKKVAQKIQSWVDENGSIDAQVLYQIRKDVINEKVRAAMRGQDPAAVKKRAAQVAMELRPAIDDAIETAGGAGWKEYLQAFSTGAREVDRMKLVAKAQQLYAENPKGFMRLVQGNNPKEIEKTLGPGSYAILQEVSGELGPSRLGALGQVAGELARDEQAALNAAAGAGQLEELLKKNQSIRLNLLNRFATITNEAMDILERNVSAAERKALDKAFQSGKNMAEALQTLPAARQAKLLNLFYTRQATPAVTRATGISAAQPNTMAPPVENRNAMAK